MNHVSTNKYLHMKYDPDKYHRHSIRLKGYDYSESGAYFVTICTQDRECLFGDVLDGEMRLNDVGQVVKQWWNDIPVRFSHVELDEFVVMPNHFHGIIVFCNDNCRGEVSSPIPLTIPSSVTVLPIPEIKQGGHLSEGGDTPPLQRRGLGQIIAYFKYQSAKQINLRRDTPAHPIWQRNYYERIIRSEEEINHSRNYIIENPLKWGNDEDNPAKIQCPPNL